MYIKQLNIHLFLGLAKKYLDHTKKWTKKKTSNRKKCKTLWKKIVNLNCFVWCLWSVGILDLCKCTSWGNFSIAILQILFSFFVFVFLFLAVVWCWFCIYCSCWFCHWVEIFSGGISYLIYLHSEISMFICIIYFLNNLCKVFPHVFGDEDK